ncbi:hypothetical protein [Kineococcus sp. SYSU DK005]|uniref:hypothetical protein n=1 Tax=Kineococcus sp. SYSU DK005 TaxID=3383126 RepID=UPI003D7DEAD7
MTAPVTYVRYQLSAPDPRGRHLGVFAAVNALRKHGRLTPEQEAFVERANAAYDAAYPDPTSVDPTVYDRARHPLAAAWFKDSATHLLTGIAGYLDLLDAHGLPWQRLRTSEPGRVVYEDEHQVVVTPHSTRSTHGAGSNHSTGSTGGTGGTGGSV